MGVQRTDFWAGEVWGQSERTSSESPLTTCTSGAIDCRYSCVSASQTLPVQRIDWILPAGREDRTRPGLSAQPST